MSVRNGAYVLFGFNVIYIGLLAVCAFKIGDFRPQDFSAMREKVLSSPSIEDLRPRAIHAISAIESGDRVIGRLHEVIVRLVRLGIAAAIVNSIVIYFLFRRCVTIV